MPIYFARAAGTNTLKIGWCKNDPLIRIKDLQTGCHHSLELMATRDGTIKDEKTLHKAYESHRVRGEWFRMSRWLALDIALSNPHFARYAALEPGLVQMAQWCGEVDDSGPSFCANGYWYSNPIVLDLSLKDLLTKSIGWYRRSGPEELKTEEAYDRVYEVLFNLLPSCRNCNCL